MNLNEEEHLLITESTVIRVHDIPLITSSFQCLLRTRKPTSKPPSLYVACHHDSINFPFHSSSLRKYTTTIRYHKFLIHTHDNTVSKIRSSSFHTVVFTCPSADNKQVKVFSWIALPLSRALGAKSLIAGEKMLIASTLEAILYSSAF